MGRPGRRDSASQLETMSRSRRLLGSRRARRSLRGPVDWAGFRLRLLESRSDAGRERGWWCVELDDELVAILRDVVKEEMFRADFFVSRPREVSVRHRR